ncbi:MAG: A/G-specific adenine glycosylase [Maricaulaceae bacterium]
MSFAFSAAEIAQLRAGLLDWYDREGRTLPWRIRPEDRAAGRTADPYRVWLSEIMLQQTTVPHATPYYAKFLELFPTVHDLARAPRETVMAAWAGLGYYARARNLHACAQTVARDFGGQFPNTEAELLSLPGVGAYTAAAIAAAAFDRPANVVDGNVERVITRLFALEAALPRAKPEIRRLAGTLVADDRPGDYAQALMDLGATVCTPRQARCGACPWSIWCRARAEGAPERFPIKEKKQPKPVRYGVVFWIEATGGVWLRRRPDQGLLGGMAELPGTPWRDQPWTEAEARIQAPLSAAWSVSPGQVRHVFTHFALELAVWRAAAPAGFALAGGWRQPVTALKDAGLPSVMAKAVKTALG